MFVRLFGALGFFFAFFFWFGVLDLTALRLTRTKRDLDSTIHTLQLMASFIIKCGSQIEIIRCALAGTNPGSQRTFALSVSLDEITSTITLPITTVLLHTEASSLAATSSSQAAAGGAAAVVGLEQGSRLAHYGGLVAYLAEVLHACMLPLCR